MILVDSSVWIDHLRQANEELACLLEEGSILGHPFVTGEIALGSLRNRKTVLSGLQELPQAAVAEPEEILIFLERNSLFGLGIGYVDAHLLASVRLMPGASLLTRDKRLLAVAEQLGMSAGRLH